MRSRRRRSSSSSSSMKTTISKPPATLHRSSLASNKDNGEHFSLKGRAKVLPVHATKTYRRCGSKALPLIPNICTSWKCTINFMPWPLYSQAKNSHCPAKMRPGGSRANLGILERRKILCHWQESNSCTTSPYLNHAQY